MKIRVSLAQFDVRKGNPRVNWTRVQELADTAQQQGAHVMLLPELWDIGFALEDAKAFASSLSGGLFAQVGGLAQSHKMFILGSMIEKRGLGISNTAAIFSPNRGVMGAYRKLHLFPDFKEDQWLTPGEAAQTFDLPWGMSAIAICYDLRFPELFRRYAVEGTKITFLPAQWPAERIDHFRTLIQARAIENQMYMVAVNRVGADENVPQSVHFGGHSMVIDPLGKTIIELGENEGVFTVELDLDVVEKIRRHIPVLENRRPELYRY